MQENHYRYFKELYDEEIRRTGELHDNAKVNTTIVSLYAGFVALTGTKSPPEVGYRAYSPHAIPGYLFVIALAFLFLSIMISLIATRIARYQVPNKPRNVFNAISSYDSDSEFYEDRVVDLVVACEYNSRLNDRKVAWLWLARSFLLLGMAAHFCYHVSMLIRLGDS